MKIRRQRSAKAHVPRKLTRLGAVLAAVWCWNAAEAGDWPQWLGPARNGLSTETIEPWTDAPKVIWRKPVGNAYCTPVAAKNVVYVHAAVPGSEAEQVTAFDLATGDEKWTQSYPRGAYMSALGVGPRATPTVADKHLVTFGITGELTCFNSQTGEKIWQINPYRDNNLATPGFGVCSSPLVLAGRIYIPVGGSGMAIAAYDIETGKLAWKALDEPASSASPIAWQRIADAQSTPDVVMQTTLRVVGVDPQNGGVRWEHPLVFQPSGVAPTPLVAQDRLICTTQDTGTLAVDAPSEQSKQTKVAWWHQNLNSYFSTGSVAADGRVFVVTNAVMPLPRADVRCLDPSDGKELWRKEGLGYFHVGLIATANDRLLLLDDSGKLILAGAGRDGFRELCRAKVCGGTFANPVLVDGRLIVRDDKELVCLQLGAAD
jgi:outer membrane protein assembly factor BamB